MLFGLLLVAILVIAALVIDLSFVRNSRQDSKSVADAATAAAMQSVATADGKLYPWAGACAGLAYLIANDSGASYSFEYRDGNGTVLTTDPCLNALTQRCFANVKTSWAWIRATDGERVVDIRGGYDLPDPAFPEDAVAYNGDTGDADLGGCDHLATIIADVDDPFFGGVAGASKYETAIRSVGRATLENTSKTPPAFLLLERNDCNVLDHNVGVGGGEGIAVGMPSATTPGHIHLDSSGTASTCSGASSGGNTLYSTLIGSIPGLRIHGTAANPGRMTLRGLNPAPEGNPPRAWSSEAGVCTSWRTATATAPATCLATAPVQGPIVGRAPVDDKYNPTPGSGLSFLQDWHRSAVIDARRTSAPTTPAGVTWHTVTTCSGHKTTTTDAATTATHVFVNCPGGYSPDEVSFSAASEVIFNGPVTLGSGKVLRMPVASRVVVGGNDSDGITTAGGSVFTINTAAVPTVGTYRSACSATDSPPVPGPSGVDTSRRIATLTVFGGRTTGSTGALILGGIGALCQTSVYLAGPVATGSGTNTTYNRLSDETGAYDSSCVDTPCPSATAVPFAHLRMPSGGGPNASRLRWSAPNRRLSQPPVGAAGTEDLALWTESAGDVRILGELDVNGVLFLPNGTVQMQSPSAFDPRDSQFIARRLSLRSGTLYMEPSAGNSVLVDSLKGVGLVR